MKEKRPRGPAATDSHALQARMALKAARIAAGALVALGSVVLIIGMAVLVGSLLERRRAAGSSDWPFVDGLIVFSEVAASSLQSDGAHPKRFERVYRAKIVYTYRVDNKWHTSSRVRFSGRDTSGARFPTTRVGAEEEAKQYPPGTTVRVYYDRADPGTAVLQPGVAQYDVIQLYGPGGFVLGALVLGILVPLAIKQGARKTVAWLAGMSPAAVWEAAAEYGMLPPAGVKGLGPEPVQKWPVEARRTLRLKGREVTFEIGPCLVHTEGDFAGNLDVPVRITPIPPVQVVTDNLWLKVPGSDMLLGVLTCGETTEGLEAVFSLRDISSALALGKEGNDDESAFDSDAWQRETMTALTAVDVLWGTEEQTRLGKVPCSHESLT